MTESQKNQCFYTCTHGRGGLGAEACNDSCYGGR
jgi:hypothetical protein